MRSEIVSGPIRPGKGALLSPPGKHSTSRDNVREVKGNDPKKLRCWTRSSGQIDDVGARRRGGSLSGGRKKQKAKSERRGRERRGMREGDDTTKTMMTTASLVHWGKLTRGRESFCWLFCHSG